MCWASNQPFSGVGTLSNYGLRHVKSVAANQECPNHQTERIQARLIGVRPTKRIIGPRMLVQLSHTRQPPSIVTTAPLSQANTLRASIYIAAQGDPLEPFLSRELLGDVIYSIRGRKKGKATELFMDSLDIFIWLINRNQADTNKVI